MADAYVAKRKRSRGTIGEGAVLRLCPCVRNVNVGLAAVVDGALSLENGSILSIPEAPSTVGAGVVAEDFLIGTGSIVDGGAILKRSLVGQGCRIGRQFSAEGSAFFANSEGLHGEAVSLLAGPYTITHHKNTLMIAALTSFFNAGSGTNQSNHMYKLGPVHQGIVERGSKTGSASYLLWPARIGAFTVVLGKHYANFDTRNLPFSYINVDAGRSVLSPGVNLFTVGTRRDGAKWPARDRRTDPDRLDRIRFEVLSPLTVCRMIKGLAELTEIYETTPRKHEYVNYNGIWIKRVLCRPAKKHYDLAIRVYLGGLLVDRLATAGAGEALGPRDTGAPPAGVGEWVDLLGLLAPKREVEVLCDAVEAGEVADLAALEARLTGLFDRYDDYAWNWAREAWKERTGKHPARMNARELAKAVSDWEDAATRAINMVLADAGKEFSEASSVGFGIDGDGEVRALDFAAVRGRFDDNRFVQELKRELDGVGERAEAALKRLERPDR